jgi:hypothetical protein
MYLPRQVELLSLLKRAEEKLRAIGSRPIPSSYDSAPAIADVLAAARVKIAAGDVDVATQKELWGIFAPTCDWDDVIGDVDLGNAIFEILDEDRPAG